MALRQPTLQASRHRTSTASEQLSIHIAQSPQPTQRPQYADSQEWILFDPSPASTTDRTFALYSAQTPTVSRSQISDFGSLETGAWSYDDEEVLEEEDNDGDCDDGELDSLDSHLPEFRSEYNVHPGAEPEPSRTVLPTHDGLGSFRLGHTVMGDDIQEHLYKFERFNPRRVKKRKETQDLGIPELSSENALEAERIRRIETWRLQNSRALLDEIKRESRRKLYTSHERTSTKAELAQQNFCSTDATKPEAPSPGKETFWKRITRRVIRDLIGIDDNLLSILFGESLPYDLDTSSSPAPPTLTPAIRHDQSSWEYKLLERIAYELDILAHHISDHSVISRNNLCFQNVPLSYAGLPIITETKDTYVPPKGSTELESSFVSGPAEPEFHPSIPNYAPFASGKSTSTISQSLNKSDLTTEALAREEWERDLNLKVVYKYIRDRVTSTFSPSSSSPSVAVTVNSNRLASTNTADVAARVARVRQQHPLVSERPLKQSLQSASRTWKVSLSTGSVGSSIVDGGAVGALGGKANVACRTRRSSKESSSHASERDYIVHSGSSKHYWDWAGSVESGNVISGIGAMESWGEV